MAYLLDTNVFIQARDVHYGFNLCPGFWNWIDDAHARGIVLSVKEIRDELLRREDDLSKWCKTRKSLFEDSSDSNTYESLKLLTTWVCDNYAPAYQAEFLGCADFPLIGYAHAHGHIVVTNEVYADGHKVKIPKACRAMAVTSITPYEMLINEGVRFVLENKGAPDGS